ncbi:MAG: UDP-2,3-diacylglucosamine diphosphatase [Burkholderiaceae bacterium]|nr:UDP-2,3-diacylglucosamine diphosphatase [Burkholderiaceae bacterium]
MLQFRQGPPAINERAPAASAAPPVAPRRVRAIFISDVHLGTRGCKAAFLLDFLRHHEADYLYLVGDIIDGWALKKSFYWHQTHNDVVQKILRRARHGTRVIYVPGNHDEAGRQFAGLDFGGIAIRAEAEHRLLDGRRLWIVHGDLADGIIRNARWLALLGDTLYTFALWLNHHYNRLRSRLGLRYWSLSQYLKHAVKNAAAFISDFERVLLREAARRGYDGVICGHIHKAEIREADGLLYANAGDWVESLTALVETHEGALQLVEWNQILAPGARVPRWNDDADPPATPPVPVAAPAA